MVLRMALQDHIERSRANDRFPHGVSRRFTVRPVARDVARNVDFSSD